MRVQLAMHALNHHAHFKYMQYIVKTLNNIINSITTSVILTFIFTLINRLVVMPLHMTGHVFVQIRSEKTHFST